MSFRAVLFDWRGTLATTLSEEAWAAEALRRLDAAGADDAAATLRELCAGGLRLAVVSDSHVDIRPAFAAAGLDGVIDVFTLSVEHGIQKPDPRMFTRTLRALNVQSQEALMVGDRSGADGAAVECGVATLCCPR